MEVEVACSLYTPAHPHTHPRNCHATTLTCPRCMSCTSQHPVRTAAAFVARQVITLTSMSPDLSLCVQNAHQVVPAVVQLLQQLPGAWLTAQTGPKQVQADWTQVMMDLRK